MTEQISIEVVKKSVEVGLPKRYLAGLREQSANHLEDFTDEQIVEAIAENILERYFNTEYFDIEALINAS